MRAPVFGSSAGNRPKIVIEVDFGPPHSHDLTATLCGQKPEPESLRHERSVFVQPIPEFLYLVHGRNRTGAPKDGLLSHRCRWPRVDGAPAARAVVRGDSGCARRIHLLAAIREKPEAVARECARPGFSSEVSGA